MSPIFLNVLIQISKKVDPLADTPKISLTCDVTMIKATADVNPDETGPDTKFTRNPKPKVAINSSIMPVNKLNRIAFGTEPRADWNVKIADIAVGPIGTSLQLPSII